MNDNFAFAGCLLFFSLHPVACSDNVAIHEWVGDIKMSLLILTGIDVKGLFMFAG